jgi:hypothetical protein
MNDFCALNFFSFQTNILGEKIFAKQIVSHKFKDKINVYYKNCLEEAVKLWYKSLFIKHKWFWFLMGS